MESLHPGRSIMMPSKRTSMPMQHIARGGVLVIGLLLDCFHMVLHLLSEIQSCERGGGSIRGRDCGVPIENWVAGFKLVRWLSGGNILINVILYRLHCSLTGASE